MKVTSTWAHPLLAVLHSGLTFSPLAVLPEFVSQPASTWRAAVAVCAPQTLPFVQLHLSDSQLLTYASFCLGLFVCPWLLESSRLEVLEN